MCPAITQCRGERIKRKNYKLLRTWIWTWAEQSLVRTKANKLLPKETLVSDGKLYDFRSFFVIWILDALQQRPVNEQMSRLQSSRRFLRHILGHVRSVATNKRIEMGYRWVWVCDVDVSEPSPIFFRIKIGDDVADDSFFIDFREAEIHQGRTHKSLQTAQIEFLDLFSLSLSVSHYGEIKFIGVSVVDCWDDDTIKTLSLVLVVLAAAVVVIIKVLDL